jgi:hypothetical protein
MRPFACTLRATRLVHILFACSTLLSLRPSACFRALRPFSTPSLAYLARIRPVAITVHTMEMRLFANWHDGDVLLMHAHLTFHTHSQLSLTSVLPTSPLLPFLPLLTCLSELNSADSMSADGWTKRLLQFVSLTSYLYL